MGSWQEQSVDQRAGGRRSILHLGRERVLTHQRMGVRGPEHSGVRGRGAMVQCWTERAVPTGRIDRAAHVSETYGSVERPPNPPQALAKVVRHKCTCGRTPKSAGLMGTVLGRGAGGAGLGQRTVTELWVSCPCGVGAPQCSPALKLNEDKILVIVLGMSFQGHMVNGSALLVSMAKGQGEGEGGQCTPRPVSICCPSVLTAPSCHSRREGRQPCLQVSGSGAQDTEVLCLSSAFHPQGLLMTVDTQFWPEPLP